MKKTLWALGAFLTVLTIGTFSYIKSENKEKLVTLDEHMQSEGFQLSPLHTSVNEGYISDAQKKQFQQQLLAHPRIETIAEIGLNAGNSADNFFKSCSGIKKFVSFDLNQHSYTAKAVDYFSKYYGKSFEFVPGDSSKTVVEYAKQFPTQKFDLIYIDGDQTFQGCLTDLINCKDLAHSNTTVWVDDYNFPDIQKAILTLQEQGVLELDSAFRSTGEHGERVWAKVKYR